jgi:predicted DNA-binding transcriptional regulator AlpA
MPRKKTRFDLPPRKPRKFRPADSSSKIIRPVNLPHETGLSLSTTDRLEKTGKFPARIQLSDNTVGWHREDVEVWRANRQRRSRE